MILNCDLGHKFDENPFRGKGDMERTRKTWLKLVISNLSRHGKVMSVLLTEVNI